MIYGHDMNTGEYYFRLTSKENAALQNGNEIVKITECSRGRFKITLKMAKIWEQKPESTEPEMNFRNFYRHCGEEWDDCWDSTCDDECPVCGKAISPYKSEDLEEGE